MTEPGPDVAVVGGGIAGLWLLDRLVGEGFGAVLIEASALGAGQTLASQGIIHGGTKYALGGRLGEAARTIGTMPGRWRACLEGRGEVDLSGVPVLSPCQYLWSAGALGGRLAGFFASHLMASRMQAVEAADIPEPLAGAGPVYRLDEPVLPVARVLETLAGRHRAHLVQGEVISVDPDSASLSVVLGDSTPVELHPRRVLITAAAGAAALTAAPIQRRPLQMVMIRGRELPPLYAHLLGAGDAPRLTITSHPAPGGGWIWYLGGTLAESGVGLSDTAQCERARQLLAEVLPGQRQDTLELATLSVDRIEPHTAGGRRPDAPVLLRHGAAWSAWPVKLALAPMLADHVLAALARDGIAARNTGWRAPPDWPRPARAPYPWEADLSWN